MKTVTHKFRAPVGNAFFVSPESLIEFSLLPSPAVQEEVQARPHACRVLVKKIHN